MDLLVRGQHGWRQVGSLSFHMTLYFPSDQYGMVSHGDPTASKSGHGKASESQRSRLAQSHELSWSKAHHRQPGHQWLGDMRNYQEFAAICSVAQWVRITDSSYMASEGAECPAVYSGSEDSSPIPLGILRIIIFQQLLKAFLVKIWITN